MTVTYTHEVADSRLGGFSSLLIRWKGSVYKLFYKEFLIYTSLYSALTLVYRLGLSGDEKIYFEKLCVQFQHYTDLIPISFVLGFYVTIVVGRWWSQFENLPFPDRLMMIIGSSVHGADDRGRLIRRTLLRYLNQAQVLTYRCMSTAVYKRFPTIEHVVAAGIMTENEYQQYKSVQSANLKYWVPLLWFSNLVSKVRQEGRIYDDMTYKLIMEELNVFRGYCGMLVSYDWISVPLVYTQVVTVAVYMFFVSTLLSRQYLDPTMDYPGHEVDLYVPIFTICQFFFYVGWLKVAEQLINPFGEDDDDFEVNWCIDRNIEVSMLAADQMYAKHPKLEKDKFWNDSCPSLPYTAASANHKVQPFMGSTFDMRVDKGDLQAVYEYLNVNRMNPVTEKPNDSMFQNKQKTHAASSKPLKDYNANSLLNVPRLRHHTAQRFDSDTTLLLTSSRKQNGTSASSDSSDDDEDLFTSPELSNHDDLNHDGDDSMTSGSDSDDNADNDIDASAHTDDASNADDIASNDEDTKTDAFLNKSNKSEKAIQVNTNETINESNSFTDSGSRIVSRSPDDRGFARPSPKRRPVGSAGFKTVANHNFYRGNVSNNTNDDTDKDEERRNAERRIVLSGRRRKTRNAFPPRKRSRKSDNGNYVWLRRRQRRWNRGSSLIASPENGSIFSETDMGSAPAIDSPFGSIMSCSTSIPSPKQLRWAFRTKAMNVYADNTSMTSSMPSPSGTEGVGTDTVSTPGHPWSFRGGEAHFDSFRSNSFNGSGPMVNRSSNNSPFNPAEHGSARIDEVIMPYTDDLRKRLQILPVASPAPTSPSSSPNISIQDGVKWPHTKWDNLLMIDTAKTPKKGRSLFSSESPAGNIVKKQAGLFKKQLKDAAAGKSQSFTSSLENSRKSPSSKTLWPEMSIGKKANGKIPSLSKDKNNNTKLAELDWDRHTVAIALAEPKEPNRSGLWNALKTWNTKRKETKAIKTREMFFRKPVGNVDILPTIESESSFSRQTDSSFSWDQSFANIRKMSNDLVLTENPTSDNLEPSTPKQLALSRSASKSEQGLIAVLDKIPDNADGKSLEEVKWENECSENQRMKIRQITLRPSFLAVPEINQPKNDLNRSNFAQIDDETIIPFLHVPNTHKKIVGSKSDPGVACIVRELCTTKGSGTEVTELEPTVTNNINLNNNENTTVGNHLNGKNATVPVVQELLLENACHEDFSDKHAILEPGTRISNHDLDHVANNDAELNVHSKNIEEVQNSTDEDTAAGLAIQIATDQQETTCSDVTSAVNCSEFKDCDLPCDQGYYSSLGDGRVKDECLPQPRFSAPDASEPYGLEIIPEILSDDDKSCILASDIVEDKEDEPSEGNVVWQFGSTELVQSVNDS